MAENKFLDDIAKFGNTTLTAMSSMQRQVRKWAGEQVTVAIENMELVTKKELDKYKDNIADMQKKLDELEAKLSKAAAPKSEKSKTSTTKPKTKK